MALYFREIGAARFLNIAWFAYAILYGKWNSHNLLFLSPNVQATF
jgi:hypothetical protein